MRSSDDDHVASNHRCRLISNLARDQIDLLVVVELQIDDSIDTKTRDPSTRLRIQRDHPVTRSYIEDAFLPAIRPIRDPPTRQLPRSIRASLALIFRMNPL